MTDNRLKLNDDKTEAILFHSKTSFSSSTKPDSLQVGSSSIPFAPSARNLGFIITQDMSLDAHITQSINHVALHMLKLDRLVQLGNISLSLQLKLSSALSFSLVLTIVTLSSPAVLNIYSRNLTKYNTQQHDWSCKHAKQITSHLYFAHFTGFQYMHASTTKLGFFAITFSLIYLRTISPLVSLSILQVEVLDLHLMFVLSVCRAQSQNTAIDPFHVMLRNSGIPCHRTLGIFNQRHLLNQR